MNEDIKLSIQFLNSNGDSIEYSGDLIIYAVHAHADYQCKIIKGKNESYGAGKENEIKFESLITTLFIHILMILITNGDLI